MPRIPVTGTELGMGSCFACVSFHYGLLSGNLAASELAPVGGRDDEVGADVADHEHRQRFCARVTSLVQSLLPVLPSTTWPSVLPANVMVPTTRATAVPDRGAPLRSAPCRLWPAGRRRPSSATRTSTCGRTAVTADLEELRLIVPQMQAVHRVEPAR